MRRRPLLPLLLSLLLFAACGTPAAPDARSPRLAGQAGSKPVASAPVVGAPVLGAPLGPDSTSALGPTGSSASTPTTAPPSASAALAPVLDLIAPLRTKPPAVLFSRPALGAIADDDDARTWWEDEGPKWIDARVAEAKKGAPELVRAVLNHHGAWGCMCPDYFFGTSSGVNPSNRWVAPTFSTEAHPPDLGPAHANGPVPDSLLLVEGWFTGKVDDVRYAGEITEVARFNVARLRVPRAAELMPRIVGTTLPKFAPIRLR